MTPKNSNKADSLTAVFESGNETCVKTASNVAEFFDGNGSVEFAVGLLTEKTIDKFTATISDSSKANSSASASWWGNEGTDHKIFVRTKFQILQQRSSIKTAALLFYSSSSIIEVDILF